MAGDDRETEVKFYVRDLKGMQRRLRELGGRLIHARVLETNLRYDTRDRVISGEGSVLRLRQDETAHLTFKAATRPAGGALTRTEIEFTVGDFGAARRFLEALGYQVIFTYEKQRTTYQLDGALVMLDELPYGSFVEIEGELASLEPAAKRLGLDWQAAVPMGYHALFERVRRSLDLRFRDLSFENFRGLEVAPEDLGVRPAD